MLVLIVGMAVRATLSRNRRRPISRRFRQTGQPEFTGNVPPIVPHLLRRSGHGTENIGESINEGIAAAYKVAGRDKA